MSKSRRRSSHDEEAHDNHERWLLTYSDMITLLMVLFIVLFALGQTNIRKFNAFRQSFHAATIQPAPVTKNGTGVLSADNSVQLKPAGASVLPNSPTPAESAAQTALQQKIESTLSKAGVSAGVSFHQTPSGLAIDIATDKVLFATDSAQLLAPGIRIIDALTPLLRSLPNDLDVQGHTDDEPITGGIYASNWALSTARAVSVLEYLLGLGLPASRLSATGYGDTRPLASNSTTTGRATNRRVEILVLSQPQPS